VSFEKFLSHFTKLLRILMHEFVTSEAYPDLFFFAICDCEFSSDLTADDTSSSNQDRLSILDFFMEVLYFFDSILDANCVLASDRRSIRKTSAKDKVVVSQHFSSAVWKFHVDGVISIHSCELSLLKSHLFMIINSEISQWR